MSILFVLLMFLLILSISYFTREKQPLRAQPVAGPRVPRFEREYGFEIPQNYAFHPGHTWLVKEGPDSARIGLDSFAANLIGKIDHIEVIGQNRWVRQGQKIMTLKSGPTTIDLMSPVEGVITAINTEALEDPSLVTRDPYKNGWIALIKSPRARHQPEESRAGSDGCALDAKQRDAAQRDAGSAFARAGAGWRPASFRAAGPRRA